MIQKGSFYRLLNQRIQSNASAFRMLSKYKLFVMLLSAPLYTFCSISHTRELNTNPPAMEYDDLATRRAKVLSMMQDRFLIDRHEKFRSYDILGWTAAHGCGPAELGEYLTGL